MDPYANAQGTGPTYDSQSDPMNTIDTEYPVFDLDTPDDQLVKMLVNELADDASYWNQNPWNLASTDAKNLRYFIGDQFNDRYYNPLVHIPYVDNRMFASTRAVLAYVTGQLTKPSIIPSKSEQQNIRMANQMEQGLYQHAQNNNVNMKMRLAAKNLIIRKRGCLKLRFDKDAGPYGDIVTENIDPSDIVVDRFAVYGQDPNRIYHRQKCTIEELCNKFPEKKADIYRCYGIKQGRYSQTSRIITYYECWFSYWEKGQKCQGLAWFIPGTDCILGKMRNPNWRYEGSLTKQRIVNLTTQPIKPFIWLNYINSGRSYIDETCLFDQAKPQQDILNRRGRQIMENANYANPRLLANGKVWSQEDADKFVNTNPKTIGLVDNMEPDANINNAFLAVNAQMLPAYVIDTLYDARNEIDTMLGTPAQFRGEQPHTKNRTLGQDVLIKQQAGSLQDDLVRAVNDAMAQYYTYLLQMLKVYTNEDYQILTKGKTGEYNFILLNSDNIDTNVKVTVETDSNLPLDKESQKAMALQLAAMPGRIDDLSLFEMLGLPDPDKLAERVQKYNIDRRTYMESIEQQLFNAEAEADLTLVIAGREPEERDDYNAEYLNYCNWFITTNRFMKLDEEEKSRVTFFVGVVADKAAMTESLQADMLNPAGMKDTQPVMPMEQAPGGPGGVPGSMPPGGVGGAGGLMGISPQQQM